MASESSWTFEMEVTLRRMWSDGHSARVIGEALGVSRCAVLGKRFRLQLGFPEGGFLKVTRPYRPRAPKPKAAKPEPAPAPVPAPKPAPVKPIVKPRWLALGELGPTHCHWPEGNQAPFVFCGADIEDSGPYCVRHMQEAHNRKTAA